MMLRASWGSLEASNASQEQSLCLGKKVSWGEPDAFGIIQPTAGKPSIPFPVPHSNVEPALAPQPSSVSPPLTLPHLNITPKAASPLHAEGSRWLRE